MALIRAFRRMEKRHDHIHLRGAIEIEIIHLPQTTDIIETHPQHRVDPDPEHPYHLATLFHFYIRTPRSVLIRSSFAIFIITQVTPYHYFLLDIHVLEMKSYASAIRSIFSSDTKVTSYDDMACPIMICLLHCFHHANVFIGYKFVW